MEQRQIAFGTFLDIEGAFDRISSDVIIKSDEEHVLGLAACREAGKVTAKLAGEILEGFLAKGSVGGHFMASFVESRCG